MPTRKQFLSILVVSAAFVTAAVVAANLHTLETTGADLGQSVAVAGTAPAVTVAWVTDFDPQLGDDRVVGATLTATDGTVLENSTVELTIADADGIELGTISSDDGGATWSELDTAIAAGDSLVASVVINDRETIAAISTAP